MKKKAYVIFVLFIVLSLFSVSTLFANDSFTVPTSEKDALLLEKVQSFYDEFAKSIFINPIDPENEIGPKNEESELDRRSHRIRIPSSESSDKKYKQKIDK